MIPAVALALALNSAQVRTIDWRALAPLPYRSTPVITPEMLAFVANEVTTRKCPLAIGPGVTLALDVAVLVDAQDGIRTTVPRAVQCPTIEQYAAAMVASSARGNLLPRMATADQWYRATVTFTWPR
ncbi:hypothetical protein ACNFJ7_17360 [Sphingomonas sp. HT-1]|uniref:hypothetical protein n=1 Tax=unclassified Sphingomonas TaxID=196159 RepID=UPI0002FA4A93|nr:MULTISPECIES: hypothetical protein [unclassified Sphingomonas]KTF67648.1 hypothetical protein ATB93_02680 [Sphingomonas sp. WG]